MINRGGFLGGPSHIKQSHAQRPNFLGPWRDAKWAATRAMNCRPAKNLVAEVLRAAGEGTKRRENPEKNPICQWFPGFPRPTSHRFLWRDLATGVCIARGPERLKECGNFDRLKMHHPGWFVIFGVMV